MNYVFEYELIDISFGYDMPEEDVSWRVSEDGSENTVKAEIEYDADGVPMGSSAEEIKMRKQIIFDFYERWKEIHPSKAVYNKSLNEDILIRKESIVEASGHAPKRYKSTLAVIRLDEILANAVKVNEDRPKPGNKNQEKLTKMLLMSYKSTDLGTIKLTVGVRRRSQEKIQYGITAMEEGERITPATGKKKAPHKK